MILALIATTAFYRQAKVLNAHPGRAASVPFVAAGLFLIVGYFTSFALSKLAAWSGVGPGTVRIMAFMADLFLILAYLLLIRRNWLALTSPSHPDSH